MLRRIGRYCYDHHRWVALGWLLLFVTGIVVGGQVFGRLTTEPGGAAWESVKGFDRLDDVSPFGNRVSAIVDNAPLTDPAVRRAVESARADLLKRPQIGRVFDPFATPAPDLRATDGRALAIAVDLRNDLPDGASDARSLEVERRLRAIETDAPGTHVVIGGNRLLGAEINRQTEADTRFAEVVALPVTLVVMVFVFGGFVAAGLPLIGALVSIAGSLLTLLGFSYVIDKMDPSVVSVCTVLGLGLSIDYSLLMVSRYREERGLGFDPRTAVERTSATAGRTVLFSALTVATSLSGLFLFDLSIFRAIGAAGVSVVLVAVFAALTLTPALLGSFSGRLKTPDAPVSDAGPFRRLAAGVQRRPVVVTALVTLVLLASAVPFLGVTFRNGGADLLPGAFESRHFAELDANRFPEHGTDPVIVVAELPLEAMRAYADSLGTVAGVPTRRKVEEVGGGVSRLEVTPSGSSQSDGAQQLVRTLRANRPPARSWVTGSAALLVDFKHSVAQRVPWALAVVVGATFVLLFFMTGSLLVPFKALVMNVLSLGASFGALVWVFQDGHLSGLLGFDSNGGLETWVPVIVFAFAYGLSMDYEVFLLSRIKELYDSGHNNNEAVAFGLQRSGRIITLAAMLVVIVFAGFASGKMLSIKELGVALAIAVFVDATLVRCLLVPATMTLLGDLNWWAPAPLRRLYSRFGLRERPMSGPAAAAASGARAGG